MTNMPSLCLRRDVVFNRSIIFSPARAKRPSYFKSHQKPGDPAPKSCAFCKHHEHECALEIFRVPPDTPDWKIRVIENLYLALNRTLNIPNPNPHPNFGGGCELVLPGFGFHDVIIETPDHGVNLSDLSPKEIGDVLLAYKDQIRHLAKIESVKYVQVKKKIPELNFFVAVTEFEMGDRVGLTAAKATVQGVRKIGNPVLNLDHLWAAAFLVLGFKSEHVLVQLNTIDLVLFIRRVAIPSIVSSSFVFLTDLCKEGRGRDIFVFRKMKLMFLFPCDRICSF